VRVLYLTPGHPVHDARFAEAIALAGHEAFVRVVPDSLSDDGARRELVRTAVATIRPDVIHAGPIQSIARLVGEIEGHPLLAVSWGFDLLAAAKDPAKRDQAIWTLQHADALLVDCAATRIAAEALGMPGSRIVTLPWGVDLGAFQPGRTRAGAVIRKSAHWDDAIVVLMTRTLEPLYGVDVALSGFLAAADARPGLSLLVVGDGSLRSAMEEQVALASATSRVRFTGRLSPDLMRAQFSAADIYLSASHADGTSLSLLEAMATALPAIVSDVGGNREWVEPGRSGQLFPDGDSAALAAALIEVTASGRDHMHELGKRGRQIVEDRANWKANSSRLFHAYELARAMT
jgi:Glycosyltransferase